MKANKAFCQDWEEEEVAVWKKDFKQDLINQPFSMVWQASYTT
jgi:hypothetical protein